MENKKLKEMLALSINPRATTAQLQAAIDYIIADIEASNARQAALPPVPQPTPAERLAAARRAANANLARRLKR